MPPVVRSRILVVDPHPRVVQRHVEIVGRHVDVGGVLAEARDALHLAGPAADLNAVGDALVHPVRVIAVGLGGVHREVVIRTSGQPPLRPLVVLFGQVRLELPRTVLALQQRDQFDRHLASGGRLQHVSRIVHHVEAGGHVGHQLPLDARQPPGFVGHAQHRAVVTTLAQPGDLVGQLLQLRVDVFKLAVRHVVSSVSPW